MDRKQRSHGTRSARRTAAPRELVADGPGSGDAWTARVITLLPEAFPGLAGASVTGRALERGLWRLETIDLRAFGKGPHRNVDDTPAGGGAGMVLRADVVGEAIEAAVKDAPDRAEQPLIHLSPRGRPFDQARAADLAGRRGAILVCGRFEGLDQRVIDHFGIEEVSMGDFVLTGGEIAAQAVIDATVRLLPGVLGSADSPAEESFSDGLLEYPHYTRPRAWNGREIPDVLLSGNHREIEEWRRRESEALTRRRRPDLWAKRGGA